MNSTTLNSRKGQVAQHWRGALPVHDACDLFPTLTEPELLGLGEDIRRNGQQVEIALFVDENGVEKLLDGRNRLDAMEGIGIPVIKDGELNRDAVRAFNVPGNTDPYKYVLSVNILRRHLTNEQKNELAEELIKRNPNQSNRAIAKLVKRDDKTVGTIRKKMESRSEIPHVETRTDTKGRKQPARKPSTKTAGPRAPKPVAKKPEVQELKQEPHSIAATLDYHFNALLALCGDASKWSESSAVRKARRVKALKKLRTAWSELVELAKPAARRGRPPKARAS